MPRMATRGAEASARWLAALGLREIPHWHVSIELVGGAATTFELDIYAEEWGFAFRHARRASWIRVTDIAFVHGRDDFDLLARTPELLDVDTLLAELEAAHDIAFRRGRASVRTNLAGASEAVREWIARPVPHSTVKKTVELCGHEMQRGIRCTKNKGHDDDHEVQGRDGRGQLRWK